MIKFFGVYEAFSVSSNTYGLSGQAGSPWNSGQGGGNDVMNILAGGEGGASGQGGASGLEGLNLSKGGKGSASHASKALLGFQSRIMVRATSVFLKTLLSKIPVRTGFLSGSFTKHNQAFNQQKSAQGNRPVTLGVGFRPDNDPEKPRHKIKTTLNEFFAAIRETKRAQGQKKATPLEFVKNWESMQDPEEMARQRRVAEHEQKVAHQKMLRKKNAARKRAGLKYSKGNVTRIGGEYYYHTKGKASRILKTPKSGIKFAIPDDPSQILQLNENGQASIEIGNAIRYFAVNDLRGKGGAPWGAMKAAKAATEAYIKQAIRKYSFISEVVAKSKIALSKDGNITISPAGNLTRDGEVVGSDVAFLTPNLSATPKAPRAKKEKMGPPKPKKQTMRNSIGKEARERQATADAHRAYLLSLRRRNRRKLTTAEKARLRELRAKRKLIKSQREEMIKDRHAEMKQAKMNKRKKRKK